MTNFVGKASPAKRYAFEVDRIAPERSKVQPVKDFAQKMVDRHTAGLAELTTLSTAAMATPPSARDNDQLGELGALKKASVEKFDDLHIDQQIEAHENTLHMMKDFAFSDKYAGLPGFKRTMTPTVEQHLTVMKAPDASDAGDVTGSPSRT
jgi:putative membrane protein